MQEATELSLQYSIFEKILHGDDASVSDFGTVTNGSGSRTGGAEHSKKEAASDEFERVLQESERTAAEEAKGMFELDEAVARSLAESEESSSSSSFSSSSSSFSSASSSPSSTWPDSWHAPHHPSSSSFASAGPRRITAWVDNRERKKVKDPRGVMDRVNQKLVKEAGGTGWPQGLQVAVDQRELSVGDFGVEFDSSSSATTMGDTLVERKTLSDLAGRSNRAHGHAHYRQCQQLRESGVPFPFLLVEGDPSIALRRASIRAVRRRCGRGRGGV